MFEIKKDKTKWIIAGTGTGCELMPKESEKIYMCLNDYIYTEKYDVKPDILCIMDILDEKPQIVSGINNLGEVVSRINALKVPFIAPYRYAEIPLSEAFPLKRCREELCEPYFKNTIGYMIAYAILHGAKEIDVYGVNQASSGEYYYEKGSVEFWLGVAIGRGIKVRIWGPQSELLTDKKRFGGNILYGYNTDYENIKAGETKFGEGVVIKLSGQKSQRDRLLRTIN